MTITKTYLRPVRFVDSPIGLDRECARLAGGMNWFTGWEVRGRDGARRIVSVGETLPDAAQAIAARITAPRAPLTLGDRVLRLDQPLVAGIVNATPDSFSDGGAGADGVSLSAAGAAMIDVGGESTRPGATAVWEQDEIGRVVPVVETLARAGVAVSIDTRKAAVMEAALAAGAHMVNDVAALLWDDRALEVVARAGCPVVLMHSPDPKTPHAETRYDDVLLDVYDWLETRVDAVVAAGVSRDKIVVDPGIGFGKSFTDNLRLLNNLALFHGLGCAIMLGASRKRLIGALSNEAPVGERLGGSLALALKGAEAGVQLLRVHDVAETAQALRVWRGLRDAALVAA